MNSNPFPNGPLSSPEWVEAIIANPDPVVRNLQITQSYHQFTVDFRQWVDPDNVCWCAFATWASKQAGRFIRNEQVPESLLKLWGMDPDGTPTPQPWYWFLVPSRVLKSPRVLRYARMTVEDTSAQIAAGNKLVYSKLAPIFADFLNMVREQPRPDEARLHKFLEGIVVEESIGEGLRLAFSYYFRALSEKDPKAKAELIYAANVLIGQHEQIRLQGPIEGALTAPIRAAMHDPERRWTGTPMPMIIRQMVVWLIETLFGAWIDRAEKKWKTAATKMLMTLATPTGVLRLGEDVPPLPGGEQYPEALRSLTLPEALPLMEQLDYTPNLLSGSAAADWASLNDRLNYILDLFRSRQQDATLFQAPFTVEQIAGISNGKTPGGKL